MMMRMGAVCLIRRTNALIRLWMQRLLSEAVILEFPISSSQMPALYPTEFSNVLRLRKTMASL